MIPSLATDPGSLVPGEMNESRPFPTIYAQSVQYMFDVDSLFVGLHDHKTTKIISCQDSLPGCLGH